MDLKDIGILSGQENLDISASISRIQNLRALHPDGVDLDVPEHLISKIEAYCDSNKIPFCYVAENTISTALTYSQLLTHEVER